MPDSDGLPPIDWSKIEFPTDRITLGQIRRQHPANLFADNSMLDQKLFQIGAFSMLCTEMDLAKMAFATALGRPELAPDDERQECIEVLNGDYQNFGLSSGLQETRLLVRRFEHAAARQAASTKSRGQ